MCHLKIIHMQLILHMTKMRGNWREYFSGNYFYLENENIYKKIKKEVEEDKEGQ